MTQDAPGPLGQGGTNQPPALGQTGQQGQQGQTGRQGQQGPGGTSNSTNNPVLWVLAAALIVVIAIAAWQWKDNHDNNGTKTVQVVTPNGSQQVQASGNSQNGQNGQQGQNGGNGQSNNGNGQSGQNQNGSNQSNGQQGQSGASSSGVSGSGMVFTSGASLAPNLKAVSVGNCPLIQDSPNGSYIQSGENQICSAHVENIPSGWQVTVDAVNQTVNGVSCYGCTVGYNLNGTLDLTLNNGAAQIGPADVARQRFCTIYKTGLQNNWVNAVNPKPLSSWAACPSN